MTPLIATTALLFAVGLLLLLVGERVVNWARGRFWGRLEPLSRAYIAVALTSIVVGVGLELPPAGTPPAYILAYLFATIIFTFCALLYIVGLWLDRPPRSRHRARRS